MADFSVNDFRNLFNTGFGGSASKTSIEETEGYVKLAGEPGAEHLENAGRQWGSRVVHLMDNPDAHADANLTIKNKLLNALGREGASREFLADVVVQLELDSLQNSGKALARRTVKRILRDFERDLEHTALKGAMADARQKFQNDQDLQNKGVKNPMLATMLAKAQKKMAKDVVNGPSFRILFKDGKVHTDKNLGAFGQFGLAKSSKDFVRTAFTFVQHKMESALGWRAMGRTKVEKEENDRARLLFLVSVMDELRARGIRNVDFKNLPYEIKDALKLEDFGEKVSVVGGKVRISGCSGKPLTARRVAEVVEAINSVFGTMQDADVPTKESAILGIFTGRIMPSSTTAMSRRSVAKGIREALGFVRDHLDDGNPAERSFRFSGQRITLSIANGGLKIGIGGKEAEYPGGCAAFVRSIEKEVATHVKFFGMTFINAEMARLETTQKRGALVGFYQDVLRSVIGEEAYKQLPIGILPQGELRQLARNALGGAYSGQRAVNALVAQLSGYGDKLQLSNETIIAVAATYDAEKAMGRTAGKVSIEHEKTTFTRSELEDESAKIRLDSDRQAVRLLVADTVLNLTVSTGNASVGQRLLAAAARDPKTFMKLMEDPEEVLELYDNGAEGDQKTDADRTAEAEVREEMASLLNTLKESESWTAFCRCSLSSEVRMKVALPLLSAALVHGADSPKVQELAQTLREEDMGAGVNFMKVFFLAPATLPQRLEEMLEVFRGDELQLGEMDESTMKFVTEQNKRDRMRVELEKAIPPPEPMTTEEIDEFLEEQQLNLDSKCVHGFVADLLLGHDTVQVDLERRSHVSPAAKLLGKVLRNFDGFAMLLKRPEYALKTFNFEVVAKPEAKDANQEPEPTLTEQLRKKLADAMGNLKETLSLTYEDGNGELQTASLGGLFSQMSVDKLRTIFTLLSIAAEKGVDSAELKSALDEVEQSAGFVFGMMIRSIFGTSAEPKVDGLVALLQGISMAAEVLDAQLAAAVNDSLDGVAKAMESAVVEAFNLTQEDVIAIKSSLDQQPEEGGAMVGFDPRTEWRKTLDDYTGGNALNPRVGQGKFIVRSMLTYFNRPSEPGVDVDLDKFNMVASLIRYTKHDSSPGEILGALLKGAGPIMQKLLQGIPSDELPEDLAEALSGMKDDLAPIDDHVVEAQLYNMVKESDGKIKSIRVINSLGAASVGQAFLCEMIKADNNPEPVVVKLLRPDVANRAQREKDFFRKVAENVKGMKYTFEGQLSTILDELDLTIEAGNIQLGAVYHENPDVRIKAVEVHPLVRPTTDTLVMKLAPGKTITRFVKEARERMAEIRREIDHVEILPGGISRMAHSPATYERCLQLRRELVKLGQGLAARNQMLTSLTKQWVGEAVFKNGFFHGDLHAGNIMSDGETMTVIDFGNATKLSAEEQENLVRVVCSCTGHRTDDFMDGFRALLSSDGRRAFDRAKARIRPMIEAILKKGTSGETGQRITAVVSLLQQNGIEIPSQVNKFSQSMLRLCDAVSQTEAATKEVEAMLQILATPPMRREGGFYADADYAFTAIDSCTQNFQESDFQNAVKKLRDFGKTFNARIKRAMEFHTIGGGTPFNFRTPLYGNDGQPVMMDTGLGYMAQESRNELRGFDQGIPGVIDQLLASGPTVDIQPNKEPEDLGARVRAEYDEYLREVAKLDEELRGAHPQQYGLDPNLGLRESIQKALLDVHGLVGTLKTQLRRAPEPQRAEIQQQIDECEARETALLQLGTRLNEKANPFVETLSRIGGIQANLFADEIEAGLSNEVPNPDGFSEAFSDCAVANVKSAMQKLGLIDGFLLGNAMQEWTGTESSLYDASSDQISGYTKLADNCGIDAATEFNATVTPLVRETIARSAVAFTFPEGIDQAFADGNWQQDPGQRELVFEMLSHNLSKFRRNLIDSAGFTEKDFTLGSGVNGYPRQEDGIDYDRALSRFRLTGMLLYALDANGGRLPGAISKLHIGDEAKFKEIVKALKTWADSHPQLCDKGVCQLVVDILSLASYGPAQENSIFCPKLFDNTDKITIPLGDPWLADTVMDELEKAKHLRKRKISINDDMRNREPSFVEYLDSKNVLKNPEDLIWKNVLEPRGKFYRARRKIAIAETHGVVNDEEFKGELDAARADYDRALGEAAAASCEAARQLIADNPTWLVNGKLDPQAVARAEVPKQVVTDVMFNSFMAAAQALKMPAAEADVVRYRALLTLMPPDMLAMLEPGSRNLDERPQGGDDVRETNATCIAAAIQELVEHLGA